MLRIHEAETRERVRLVPAPLAEYLEHVCQAPNRKLETALDHELILEKDMANLERFSPPHGRLMLAGQDGKVAGLACLQRIGPGTAEVTRMYVRPPLRRRGIARALLESLVEQAAVEGYQRIRLDTLRDSPAHLLYRSAVSWRSSVIRRARYRRASVRARCTWRGSCSSRDPT